MASSEVGRNESIAKFLDSVSFPSPRVSLREYALLRYSGYLARGTISQMKDEKESFDGIPRMHIRKIIVAKQLDILRGRNFVSY